MKPKIQIVAIHGGDPYRPYEEYIAELKAQTVDADDFKRNPGWKDRLQETLGANFEVFNPEMPLQENAQYPEWKIWFEKLIPFLNDGVILIGHSLGAIFLAKYLSENTFPKKIRAVMLVAAPYEKTGESETCSSFGFGNLSLLAKQPQNIYLYHSKDDPLVDFSDMAKFKRDLPQAITCELTDRLHIWQRDFPEIVRDILGL